MGNTKRNGKFKRKGKGKGNGKIRQRHSIRNKKQAKHPIAYGHVYSTGCVHCIRMQNDWDNLTEEVKKKNSAIELIDISQNHQEEVDATNKTYQTDIAFLGFPTIFKIMQKNAPVQYHQGNRSTEDMKKWLFS